MKTWMTTSMPGSDLTDFVSLWGIMVVRNSLTISGLCLLQGVFDRDFSVCVEMQRKVWAHCCVNVTQQTQRAVLRKKRGRGHVPTSYMMVLRFCWPVLCLFFPLSFLCSFRSVKSLNTWETQRQTHFLFDYFHLLAGQYKNIKCKTARCNTLPYLIVTEHSSISIFPEKKKISNV